MISSTTLPRLDGLGDSFATALAQGDGLGFLEALLGALPPELEHSSEEELLAWLHGQSLSTPALPQGELAGGRPAEDPEALLSLMLSGRGELLASAAEAGEMAGEIAAEAVDEELGGGFANLLSAVGPLRGAAEAARAQQITLSTPVTDSSFSEALGERLVWMVRQDVQQARIHLDPVELGPLEISVRVKDDVASVLIHAQHATTREVLEADLQRLRAMLGESGFASVDVDVARDGEHRPEGEAARTGLAPFPSELEAESEEPVQSLPRRRGLVDQYV